MTRKAIFIQRLVLGIVAGAIAALTSCDHDERSPPAGFASSDHFSPTLTRRDGGDESSCADRQDPGCPCDTEGEHVQCGKVVETLHDQLVCGQGVSVCTLGTWSECALNNSDLSWIPL